MAEMWYYTCEGKQMEPVSTAELQQLAAKGFLKSSDLVWKDGMANWERASTIRELFAEPRPQATLVDSEGFVEDRRPAKAEVVPNTGSRTARFEEDDEDYDYRPRRSRRRPMPKPGMSSGLKVGLIVGGSLLGIVLIMGLVMIAVKSANLARERAQVEVVARAKAARQPPFNFNNQAPIGQPKLPEIQNGFVNAKPAPVFFGPADVNVEFAVTGHLARSDPRDNPRGAPCKVYAFNMVAEKTYTIRLNKFDTDRIYDPYLRIEDENFVQLDKDDDSGNDQNPLHAQNAKIVFKPPQTGTYRVIVTSFNHLGGSFSLRIQEN